MHGNGGVTSLSGQLFCLGKEPLAVSTLWIRGLAGPKADLDEVAKRKIPFAVPGILSRTSTPITITNGLARGIQLTFI
jgi:hypothetical protein